MAKFSAGLTDQDELSQFPSAASPLEAMGLDPDQVRANPELLSMFGAGAPQAPAKAAPAGPMPPPADDQPDPSVKAAGALGGAAPESVNDYGMAGLSSLQQNAQMATTAAGEIPVSNPDVDRLSGLRDKLATPAPLYDPQTGKMLQQTQEYDPQTGQAVTINPKPSAGRRIWRGVRGGLTGLATGGIPGTLVGVLDPQAELGGEAYGAPAPAYQKAEQRREQELGATDDSLKTAFQNWKDQQDAYKARATEFRANAGLGKDLTTGATDMQKAVTEQENADTSKAKIPIEQETADNNKPENKNAATLLLEQRKIQQRAQDPTAQSLPRGYIRNRYILTGEIQAAHDATGEEQQVAALTAAWKRENPGKAPGTTDLATIYSQVNGRAELKADKPDEVGAIVADATTKKQAFADEWVRQPDGNYTTKDFTKRLSAEEFQDKLDQFRADANVKLAKKGAQIDAQGKVVRTAPPAPPAAAAPAQAQAAPPVVGSTVTVEGQAHRVLGYNARTKKPILDPTPVATE